MSRSTPFKATLALFSLILGCGGSEPAGRSAKSGGDDDHGASSHRGSGMSATAEIGALDEAAVDRTFEKSIGALDRCLHEGADRVEFLGGAVSFYIEVDAGGALQHAHLEESTIGDRSTEKCMLNALRSKTWPKPIGGDVGYARKSFDFDPPNDVRPPTDWSQDRVNEALEKLAAKIDECKSESSGRFKATMYVGTDGTPLAVGVTPPDERGEAAVDCLVEALKGSTYPSPGSWPAKVSFEL